MLPRRLAAIVAISRCALVDLRSLIHDQLDDNGMWMCTMRLREDGVDGKDAETTLFKVEIASSDHRATG